MTVKYTGTTLRTDWIPGVPARDLSDAEYEALTDRQRESVKQSKLYRVVTPRRVTEPEEGEE